MTRNEDPMFVPATTPKSRHLAESLFDLRDFQRQQRAFYRIHYSPTKGWRFFHAKHTLHIFISL